MERIKITNKEMKYLNNFTKKGQRKARELTRARILLLVNMGKTEMDIKDLLGIGRATVSNVKRRYRKEGLQNSLVDKLRSGQPKKYTEKHKAEIIAQACAKSPEGSKRWSLALLTEEMKKKKGFETINRESIRLILKKQNQTLAEKDVVHQ